MLLDIDIVCTGRVFLGVLTLFFPAEKKLYLFMDAFGTGILVVKKVGRQKQKMNIGTGNSQAM